MKFLMYQNIYKTERGKDFMIFKNLNQRNFFNPYSKPNYLYIKIKIYLPTVHIWMLLYTKISSKLV